MLCNKCVIAIHWERLAFPIDLKCAVDEVCSHCAPACLDEDLPGCARVQIVHADSRVWTSFQFQYQRKNIVSINLKIAKLSAVRG